MRIYVQTQGFELTSAIDRHLRKKIMRNLAGSENDVVAVDVFLEDINGPKGGADKKASLCVRLASRLSVKLDVIHNDLYHAIAVVSRKAKHSVKRTLRRHKRMEKAELRSMRHFPREPQLS
jgi:ribosome-associated translation inhibitor RaiA